MIVSVPHLFTAEEHEAMGRAGVFREGAAARAARSGDRRQNADRQPASSIVNQLNRLLGATVSPVALPDVSITVAALFD